MKSLNFLGQREIAKNLQTTIIHFGKTKGYVVDKVLDDWTNAI